MTLFDLGRSELKGLIENEPRYRFDQIWNGLYKNYSLPSELTTLPKALREHLSSLGEMSLALSEKEVLFTDDKKTIKTLYSLSDSREIESVLMAYSDRVTLCVSSQAGCAMGCVFCATGQAGFFRHLTKGEILEQIFRASRTSRDIFGGRLSNIVFMGMGEPMANYDAVIDAIGAINFEFGISARHITISTVGIAPGIRRLADSPMPISLAVSLHAANDEKRSKLVPINSRYPLGEIIEALKYYQSKQNRRISFEWAMMDGINDSPADAFELAEIARELSAHVNLIPLNPTPLWPYPGSPIEIVEGFRNRLLELDVNATIRQNRGNQIAAACGQLTTQMSPRKRSSSPRPDPID
ncbi:MULTISPECIES: 23S rRNA (adenine(2503)-C(2))-methyltransferase RlmN [Acidithrix]|uniref:Probable dual-specificity RNA methyltransferase RlmN n=1 Tax=Acidithrix ferrooxidans TaxID=1280514 RepID=A0A0D8HIY2_9ACTN|nr:MULTISPECIES: 23S rRNA (adenine(2503)-C(2))-methyltransferase RlmN [Acidithrix]KJF17747.1 putative dual-specificity RNA methyltransferase RlmN [Acidithrix ferrooxidans]CAG4922535.1 unnamed protein product [Acidithrix sp. C25]